MTVFCDVVYMNMDYWCDVS